MARAKRWYRIKRSYRVTDELYVLAETAEQARMIGWGSEEGHARQTEPRDDVRFDMRWGAARRVEPADIPVWMVKEAIRLKLFTATPEVEAAAEAWFTSPVERTRTLDDDVPLRDFLVVGR